MTEFPHQPNRATHHARQIFLVVFMCDLALARNWLGALAPLSDDLSMIAFSQHWTWDWMTKGLADYFIVYPEYYAPQSNFIRPVSNFAFWLFQTCVPSDAPFLANRIQLAILNYGTHAALTAALYLLAARVSHSAVIRRLAVLAAFAMPPFWTTPATSYTSFVFDELAVLFCVAAIVAWQSRRIILMGALLLLALLTKEITLPVIAGFGVYFILRRAWREALGPIAAVTLWAGLRLSAFGLHAEGVYVFSGEGFSLSQLLIEKLVNSASLPLGPVFTDAIFTGQAYDIFNRDGALLLANLCLYAFAVRLIFSAAFRIKLRKMIAGQDGESAKDGQDPVPLLTLISLFALLFDAYIGANYRYALNLVPFVILLVAGLNDHRVIRGACILLLAIGSWVASGPSLMRVSAGAEFETFRYGVMRDLLTAIRSHQDSARLVIANDAVSGYANPEALKIIAPTDSEILRGTSLYLDSCPFDAVNNIATEVTREGGALRVTAILPDCARFTFESSPKLQSAITGGDIRRNDRIHYEIAPDTEFSGRHLTMVMRDADLLYFDFKSGTWVFVASSGP